jgi:hypothetical protein
LICEPMTCKCVWVVFFHRSCLIYLALEEEAPTANWVPKTIGWPRVLMDVYMAWHSRICCATFITKYNYFIAQVKITCVFIFTLFPPLVSNDNSNITIFTCAYSGSGKMKQCKVIYFKKRHLKLRKWCIKMNWAMVSEEMLYQTPYCSGY